jgi:hypothetical protein
MLVGERRRPVQDLEESLIALLGFECGPEAQIDDVRPSASLFPGRARWVSGVQDAVDDVLERPGSFLKDLDTDDGSAGCNTDRADAVVASGNDACDVSRVGKSVGIEVLIKRESVHHRGRALDINAAGQVDVSVVEATIENSHANARSPRTQVPGLGGMDRNHVPLRPEERLIVANAVSLDAARLVRGLCLVDSLVRVNPPNDPILDDGIDARNCCRQSCEIRGIGLDFGDARFSRNLLDLTSGGGQPSLEVGGRVWAERKEIERTGSRRLLGGNRGAVGRRSWR